MSLHQGKDTTISMSSDIEDDLSKFIGVKGLKDFIVHRKALVYLSTTIIKCSSPITAIITADQFTDYTEVLRQITKDGLITNVEMIEMSGASVEVVSGEEEDYYDFEEEDLIEIKESFEMK
jgi:hypothetical protein